MREVSTLELTLPLHPACLAAGSDQDHDRDYPALAAFLHSAAADRGADGGRWRVQVSFSLLLTPFCVAIFAFF